MKRVFLFLFVFCSTITFASYPVDNSFTTSLEFNFIEDAYPVVAKTEKGYGTEYSIGATVYASPYSSSPSKVVVEGEEVRFSVDYNRSDWYYFSYGSEVYYFRFSK
jgi:hypothetical protein